MSSPPDSSDPRPPSEPSDKSAPFSGVSPIWVSQQRTPTQEVTAVDVKELKRVRYHSNRPTATSMLQRVLRSQTEPASEMPQASRLEFPVSQSSDEASYSLQAGTIEPTSDQLSMLREKRKKLTWLYMQRKIDLDVNQTEYPTVTRNILKEETLIENDPLAQAYEAIHSTKIKTLALQDALELLNNPPSGMGPKEDFLLWRTRWDKILSARANSWNPTFSEQAEPVEGP